MAEAYKSSRRATGRREVAAAAGHARRARASCGRRVARRCASCSTRACACSPSAASTPRASTTSSAPRARRTARSTCTSRTRKSCSARSPSECAQEMGALAGGLGRGRPATTTGAAELRRFLEHVLRDLRAASGRCCGRGWRATSRTARRAGSASSRSPTSPTALGARMREAGAHGDDGVGLRAHGAARAVRVLPRVAPARVRRRRDARHRHPHRAPRLLRRAARGVSAVGSLDGRVVGCGSVRRRLGGNRVER